MIALDASTLILLAKVDLLPILLEGTKAVMSPEVRREVSAKPEAYDARIIAELSRAGKIKVAEPAQSELVDSIKRDFGLGDGEAETLQLARERGLPIGTDDGPAIKAAKIMGVPFVTAIHVLLELRRKGRLEKDLALARLDKLQKAGRYSVRILEDARDRIRAAG